jgi:antagonist of KipI
MADRQTTGGYPVLAIVVAADLGMTAQLAPGDLIMFERCSQQDAVSSLLAQEALLTSFEAREVA